MESTGSEAKIRGSAQQVHEKYLSLARDALSSGDRIGAENYFQFADHYFRVINAANGNANGGGSGRGDRNNKIPPPPETAASRIVIDESGAGVPAARVAEKVAADPTTDPVAAPEAPAQEAAPAAKDLFSAEPKSAEPASPTEPASQAAELAKALARAKTDEAAGDSPAAPEKPQGADQGVAADSPGEEAPKRRRRSALGVGVKRTPRGRPRKAAEGAAADQPAALEVKPVRRRTRKAAAPKKTEEITPETA